MINIAVMVSVESRVEAGPVPGVVASDMAPCAASVSRILLHALWKRLLEEVNKVKSTDLPCAHATSLIPPPGPVSSSCGILQLSGRQGTYE